MHVIALCKVVLDQAMLDQLKDSKGMELLHAQQTMFLLRQSKNVCFFELAKAVVTVGNTVAKADAVLCACNPHRSQIA
jgi:hypothetical protein